MGVDERVIKETQRIVEEYRVKLRDAIHASCAIKNRVREIISDDPDFDRIKEIRRVRLGTI